MLLISCTFEEKFINENNNSKNYQLYEKKFSDIITEKEFKSSFSKVAKPNFNGSSKTIMEQQYGFEIDETAIVKEIHKDGIITYTLGIKTDSLHSNQLRNLLIEQVENNEVSAYILSYNLTAPLLPTGHNSFSLNYSTATIEAINYNTNQTSRVLLSNGCYLSNVLMCSEPWVGQVFGSIHVVGHDCFNPAYLSMQSVIDCPNEGGGGGTPIDNGGSGGSGGSSTSPTGGGGILDTITSTPCIELKKMTDNAKNKTSLETLKTKTQGTVEFGFAVKKTPTGAFADPETMIQNPKNPNAISMKPYSTGVYIIIMHNHPKPSVGPPMFSGSDVIVLADLAQNGDNYNVNNLLTTNFQEYTITLAGYDAASGTSITFAIKIKDINKFNTTLAGGDKRKEFDDLVTLTYKQLTAEGVTDPLDFGSDPRPATLHDFKNAFLKIIKNNNMGIGLYQAVPGVNNNVNWSEVVYNSSQNTSSLVPCIN